MSTTQPHRLAEAVPPQAVPTDNAGREAEGTVTKVRHQDINAILSPRDYRTQPLDGFEDCYSDIVHYIAYCTHRIWAEKSVGLIYTHYDPAVVVNTPSGTTNSVEEVVAGTLSMMQAFPDRDSKLISVAWTGNARDGFYTSHLGMSKMTNLGPSAYGPATGRVVNIRHIADCEIKDNSIYNEWLVRDNGAIVRQLGLDPHVVARGIAEAQAARGVGAVAVGLPDRAVGQRLPQPLDLGRRTREERLRHLLHDVWNMRLLDRIAGAYTPDAHIHTSPGRELLGPGGQLWQVIRMLAAFPDARLTVDHFCDVEETDGYIAAVRWTITGTHKGDGMFGPPSGRIVSILGMSHFRFDGDRIAEEWTLFDEIAILRQIYTRPDPAGI